MAEYRWNASLLRRVFVVPEDVADEHLRLAGAVQLKVLLWLSRHGGEYDDQRCADAIGASPADCRDAVRYWVELGVLDGEEVPSAVPVVAVPEKTPSKPPIVRPQVVKPQMPEVIARREGCAEFAYLLDEVSARLGKPLSPTDMETLLYLFDTAGMPAEVILMVVGYAVSLGRFSMRYIEKVALDWADREILTMADAEEYLCRMERMHQSLARLQGVCGLEKLPTAANVRDFAHKWFYEWNVQDDVLRSAYEICMKNAGKFQAKYIDSVLENWREQGGPPLQEEQSNGDYEEMVAQYIPKYKKKKKG